MVIKASRFIWSLVLLFPISLWGQEDYNNCDKALELCPNKTFTVNNIGANATLCPNCEDDFNFCFTGENSVWFTFTTNDDGGDVWVDISNIIFENLPGQGNGLQAVILEATLPCISSSYTEISNCEVNQTGNFQLSANNLPANTTYYIVVNGTLGTSSNAEATFDIRILGDGIQREAKFFIGTESTTICTGNNTTFVIDLEGCENPSTIDWFINGEWVKTTEDFLVFEDEINDQDIVTAEISCFDQCRDTILSNDLVMTVLDFPVDTGPDLTITKGESIQLQSYTSENDITWVPNYNMNDSTAMQPIVYPEETTTYFMTVSNGICTITDEVTIFVENNLEIPNTFTPNGDGVNDTWEILGIEGFPDCHVQIFTRWGQLVYETTGYNDEKYWDGTSKGGSKLSEGSYYYVINLRDESYEKPLKGTVSIVR